MTNKKSLFKWADRRKNQPKKMEKINPIKLHEVVPFTEVIYWRYVDDDGNKEDPVKTYITTEPWKLGSGEYVCRLKSFSSAVSIKHLEINQTRIRIPVDPKAQEEINESYTRWAEPRKRKPMSEKRQIKIHINASQKQPTKRAYISGKITGMEKDAYELFEAAEREVIALGYLPVNPFKLNHDHDKSWRAFMRRDIKALCDCEAIYMLDNWRQSPGANIELDIANHLEMDVIHQHRKI